ncbi:phage tail tape measure protein [Pseudomonas syringae]|uniref:phage tail tape measure protein n=1 Tax=Pseudomonas syringae TaxID=317 RepID=UPI0019176739|nr:phage tail tape measure protein [Pseudomonas syringae]QQQ52409.1 phage tail tape measure protein [Pseudomonas syringae]
MASKKLNAVITIGGSIASSLGSAFNNVKGKVGEVGSALKRLEAEQRTVTNAIQTFGKMGKNVDGLRARYVGLTSQVDRLRTAHENLNAIQNAQTANSAERAEIMGKIFETAAVGAITITPIVQAAQFETAMLGVAKQVEGARDSSGKLTKTYYEMGAAIQQLGSEIPIATNEIAEMVAAGARMGIARKELLGFTRNAAMMSSAFELPAGQLAEDMGKIAGLYKIPISNINGLADSINYLDDNAQSKGGDIINFLTRVGGSASSVKITGNSMAALGSTLLTLGETTETAGTAVNAMFAKFAAADKGTKKFKAAMAEIGLSTAAVQAGMAKNAEGTLLKIIDQVAKLPEQKRAGVLVELVGLEHQDTLAKLVGNVAEYRKQIGLALDPKAIGSMSREFQATMDTTTAQFKTLTNSVTKVSVNIGSTLLPTVNLLMGAFAKGSESVADFSREHPTLTRVIIGTTLAVTGLRLATLGGALAFTYMKGAALSVAGALAGVQGRLALTAASTRLLGAATLVANGGLVGMATRALPMVAAGIRMVGVAFVSTGIGAIITAIAVGGLMVYRNWDLVKSFFDGFGTGVVQGMAPVINAVTNLYNGLGVLKPVFDAVGTAVSEVWQYFTKFLEPVKYSSEALAKSTDSGLTFGRLVGGAINLALTPLQLLIKGITWVGENAGAIMEKVGGAIDKVAAGWEKAKSAIGLGEDGKDGEAGKPGRTVETVGAAIGKAGVVAAAANDNQAASPPVVNVGATFANAGVKAPAANDNALIPLTILPSMPPMATSRGSSQTITNNWNPTITVQGAPGMNERQLADLVIERMKQKQAVAGRGAMHDGAQ